MVRPELDSRVRESTSRGPWVPAPGHSSPADKMPSLQSRLAEMEALASMLPADADVSRGRHSQQSGHSSDDRQLRRGGRHSDLSSGSDYHGMPAVSPLKARAADKRTTRTRRKPTKVLAQKPRRPLPMEEAHRVRRRPAAVPIREPAPPSPRQAARRSAESGAEPSGSEAGGPAHPPQPHTQHTVQFLDQLPEQTKLRDEKSESKPDLLQAVLPAVPDLSDFTVAADGGQDTLQEVLHKFMWAKQQASAAANLMSSLREVVEKMDIQDNPLDRPAPASESGASSPRRYPTTAPPAPPAASSRPPAGRRAGLPSGGGASNLPNSATYAARSALQVTARNALQVTGSSLAGGTSTELSSVADQHGPPRSTRSAVSVTSSETTSLLPDESRSQLAPSKASVGDTRQGLEAGLRSGSETQLEGHTAPPAAGLLQEHHLDELRRQFDEQRERMKKMEQTNYVLTLAVDGQEKTIRTLTNQLDDTKSALLQEIQSQMAAPAAPADQRRAGAARSPSPGSPRRRSSRDSSRHRRGGATQTGPSLASVAAGNVQQDHQKERLWHEEAPLAENEVSGEAGGGGANVDRLQTEEEGGTSEGGTSPERQVVPSQAVGSRKPPRQPTAQDNSQAAPAVEDHTEYNRLEVERLSAALEAKERELASLRCGQLNTTDTQSMGDHDIAFSTPVSDAHHPAQLEMAASIRRRLGGLQMGGARARSTEVFHRAAAPAGPARRHSFTAPLTRTSREDWRPPQPPARAQRSLLADFERESLHRPTLDTADLHTEFDRQCEQLQWAVEEGRTKIRRLEEEIFELKCTRKQTRDQQDPPVLSSLGPTSAAAAAAAATGPFPGIVRMTEVKLQEAYQLLLTERQRSKQLTQQNRTAASSLEQAAAAAEQLKQQLASSVEERQQLQAQLTQTESTGSQQLLQTAELREELRRKDTLLNQTSQHLEERVTQVAGLSREVEAIRLEAAQDERRAAERLSEQLERVARLEESLATLEKENHRLRLTKEQADEVSESERRMRQRCVELQERLDQSTNTSKMLENYIHFLKTSYNSMFGTPTPAAPAGLVSFDDPSLGLASAYSTASGGSKAFK